MEGDIKMHFDKLAATAAEINDKMSALFSTFLTLLNEAVPTPSLLDHVVKALETIDGFTGEVTFTPQMSGVLPSMTSRWE